MKNIFYHASNKKLDVLLPLSNNHGGEGKACYFTSNRAYALFYIRDMNINHVTCGIDAEGIPVYYEQFPQQLKTLYGGRSGYIYTVINNGEIVSGHTNGVWISTQPIKVTSASFIKSEGRRFIRRLFKVPNYGYKIAFFPLRIESNSRTTEYRITKGR